MFSSSDLRKGLKIEIENEPWVITDFEFRKPGKGTALYRCKMKNMILATTYVLAVWSRFPRLRSSLISLLKSVISSPLVPMTWCSIHSLLIERFKRRDRRFLR